MFGLIHISIGLSVFRFVANEYKQKAIRLHSTVCNIQSAIPWEIVKVNLNYLPLLRTGLKCVSFIKKHNCMKILWFFPKIKLSNFN